MLWANSRCHTSGGHIKRESQNCSESVCPGKQRQWSTSSLVSFSSWCGSRMIKYPAFPYLQFPGSTTELTKNLSGRGGERERSGEVNLPKPLHRGLAGKKSPGRARSRCSIALVHPGLPAALPATLRPGQVPIPQVPHLGIGRSGRRGMPGTCERRRGSVTSAG